MPRNPNAPREKARRTPTRWSNALYMLLQDEGVHRDHYNDRLGVPHRSRNFGCNLVDGWSVPSPAVLTVITRQTGIPPEWLSEPGRDLRAFGTRRIFGPPERPSYVRRVDPPELSFVEDLVCRPITVDEVPEPEAAIPLWDAAPACDVEAVLGAFAPRIRTTWDTRGIIARSIVALIPNDPWAA